MSINYGQEVRWTRFNGSTDRISVFGFPSMQEAQEEAFTLARELGWTPPKWYQFWRWGDTKGSK